MPKDMSAPGALELVRRFVNSLDLDHPDRDPFLTAEGTGAWLKAHGFHEPVLDAQDAARLRALREALRRELLVHSGETDGAAGELETLLRGVGLELTFGPADTVRLRPQAEDGFAAVAGVLASRIYDAVRSGEWRRLKACRKPTCLFAFYDRSKNGSGTWCDMAICGNRAKAERRRARERVTAPRDSAGSD